MADDDTPNPPTLTLTQRYEALVLSGEATGAQLRAMTAELRAAADAAPTPQAAQALRDRAHDCESRIRGAETLRAMRLQDAADRLRHVRTTGATVHDVATLIGHLTMAADIARQLATGAIGPDNWRVPWLERTEAQLATYQAEGLEGWRKAYRK